MNTLNLEKLLNPSSIALIGASDKSGKVGTTIMKYLLKSTARVYPVNPKIDYIMHIPVYKDVSDISGDVDLAIVALSAANSVSAVSACSDKGIPFVIVVAGGFGETGAEGGALEGKLREIVSRGKTRILGPNSLGVFVPENDLDTVFVEHGDKALAQGGSVAFISQSGSVGVESLGLASNTGFGMRAFVGTGNKTDLTELDFIRHFGRDDKTDCLAIYVESVEGERDFLLECSEVSAKKPVLVLKAGRTPAGASAAGSHTGRLAGSDRVVNGAFKQYGIQRAFDDEELCDAALSLSMLKPASGNRVAVVTPAGGFGVMCTDYIDSQDSRAKLIMAELSGETKSRIAGNTLNFASTNNPVDLTASADNGMFTNSLDALIDDDGVDIIICVTFFAPPTIDDGLIKEIGRRVRNSSKPILVFTEYGPFTDEYLLSFYNEGVAGFPSISRVVRAARFLVERGEIIKRKGGMKKDTPVEHRELAGMVETWKSSLKVPGKPDEWETSGLFRIAGLPAQKSVLVEHEDYFLSLVENASLPGPYAVKICGSEILHKTELGGVALNVGEGELSETVGMMLRKFPGNSVIISNMITYSGTEFILGALNDFTFGPSVMAGAGGILTELYKDVAFRLAPCEHEVARGMLEELRIAPILEGYRGSSLDKEALVEILVRFSRLAAIIAGQGGQLDINPIVWSDDGWIILDAKAVL
ncbi:MAG: acetate--CoA ligase family protein [Spirochaetales bacterium]|nr:acetate--CoA ligase family protein [Spirochaetales bacterium]